MHQAHKAEVAKGADLKINVVGKDVCDYCKGDIAVTAQASGAKSVTISAVDEKTGLPKIYIWKPGMKLIREIRK